MTSRRDFLGILAASPLVAPVVAKEMAATAAKPKSIMMNFKMVAGERIDFGRRVGPRYGNVVNMTMAESEVFMEAIGVPSVQFREEIVIPNRLYGAYINADGDAA